MKSAVIIISLFIFCGTVNAQLGLSAFTNGLHAPGWDHDVNQQGQSFYFNSGTFVAIDYWLRMKDTRLEFHPEFSFRTNKNYYEFRTYGLHLNTDLYFLDFFNDCDCPTFTKQEPFLQKGLFFELSPGYNFMRVISFSDQDPDVEVEDKLNYFDLGFGFGLDIGLSKFVTVTPLARYRLGFGAKWERASEIHPDNSENSNLSFYEFGLRIGLRFDRHKY